MKKSLYLTSEFDGLELHIMVIEPEGEKKGVVQLCHGMMEHKERYEDYMEMLTDHGYVSVIHDHRGHGKSVDSTDDLGYFYDDTGEAIVEDAHQVTKWIKNQYPELPVHLFGHSMGSLVVRCYTKKYDEEIASLIVCGSPSKNPIVPVAIVMAKVSCVFGGRNPGKLFHKIAFDLYRKALGKYESPHAWISYNEDNVREYESHELDGKMFTNNGFLNTFLLMKETYSKKGWNIRHRRLPILFIAGEDDPCIGTRKMYKRAIDFMKKLGYPNVRGILFKNRRHEILKEDNVESVYEKVLEFLKSVEEV